MSNATPRYEVIPSRAWKNTTTGATASLYGAVPWTVESDKANWSIVDRGYTVRNRSTGTVGIGRQPWTTQAEAQVWADAENARLADIAARFATK
jgi:hypothetical protein